MKFLRENAMALLLAFLSASSSAIGVYVSLNTRVAVLETKQQAQENGIAEIKTMLAEQRSILLSLAREKRN
jgi:hypothetical protein